MKEKNNRQSNRQSWNRKDGTEERHKGSFDLNVLKNSSEYQRRIDQGEKCPKRKYAICFGYLGSKYQGLQINPDAASVEAELEKALLLCGGIQECNFGYMQKQQWSRAARTDRGVHAATQCCAMKLSMPLQNRLIFVQQLNSFLPDDIRAHIITKVSKGFNAKSHCTGRRYNYLLPTYMLQDADSIEQLLNDKFAVQGVASGAGYEGGYVEKDSKRSLTEASLRSARESLKGFRLSPEGLALLREALKQFEGTNFFHNFTTGKTAADANAQRYIIKFDSSDPFVPQQDNGEAVEYVLLSVLGQSFLLNQIRKMVALACEVVRGAKGCQLGTVKEALSVKFKMDVPMAPGVGLYLDELFFDGYNAKQRYEANNARRVASNKKNAAADAAAETASGACDESKDTVDTITEDEEQHVTKRQRVEQVTGPVGSEKSSSEVITEEETAEEALGKEEEVEVATHEEINWGSDPANRQIIVDYYTSVIHPHIIAEESAQLHYLFYLDFLRAYPHTYLSKTDSLRAPSSSGSGTGSNEAEI